MPIYTKVNGSWKTITDIEVKNSIFNTVTKGYVKINDQWKLFLSSNEQDEQYFINILQIVIPQPDVIPQPQDPISMDMSAIVDIAIPQPHVIPQPQDPLHQSNTIATITILTPTVV